MIGIPREERAGHARARVWRRGLGVLLATLAALAAVRSWADYRGAALLGEYASQLQEGSIRNPSDREGAAHGRIRILERALAHSGVEAEARTALAFELVDLRAARIFADPPSGPPEPASPNPSPANRGHAGAASVREPTKDPGRHERSSGPAAAAEAPRPSAVGATERREPSTTDAATLSEPEAVTRLLLRRALDEVTGALRANPTSTKAWLAGYRVLASAQALARTEVPVAGDEGAAMLSERYLQGAVRADPNGSELHRDLAAILLAEGRREEALDHYRRAGHDLRFDPASLGAEMLEAGYAPEEMLAAMPDSYAGTIVAGRLLQARDHLELARRVLLGAVSRATAPWEAWAELSHVAERAGRAEEALTFARKALAATSDMAPEARAEILYRAAAASRATGSAEEAFVYASRAREADPRNPYVASLLGSLLDERGDPAGAIREWTGLLENHAEDPYVSDNRASFHRRIGHAYEKLDLLQPAAEQYAMALRASPDDAEAKAALSRLGRR